MKLIDAKWYISKQSAVNAVAEIEKRGYKTMVMYTRRPDKTFGWLLKIFMD